MPFAVWLWAIVFGTDVRVVSCELVSQERVSCGELGAAKFTLKQSTGVVSVVANRQDLGVQRREEMLTEPPRHLVESVGKHLPDGGQPARCLEVGHPVYACQLQSDLGTWSTDSVARR